MSNYFLLFFCIMIDVLLLIIYFSKKRINLFENKIYTFLIVINILCLIIEMFCNMTASNIIPNAYRDFFVRLFLIVLLLWGCILTIYNTIISTGDDGKYKKIFLLYSVSFLIASIPFAFLNIEFMEYGNLYYAAGSATNYLVVIASIYILINIILILINYKTAGKKVYPVIAYMLLMVGAVLLHNIDPTLSAINCVETFVCLLMYFTIENPDIKMIENLNLTKELAEKANRAKSDFLSSMSHEIRTPLNAIVGLSEDITTYKNQVPKEVVEDTNDIQNASQTLLEIVGNILDINKIESDKMEIVENPYYFKEEIMKMCKVTATRIGEKNINFILNLAPDIPDELIGDKIHVKEIINNVLTNAIKYTDQGEIVLSIKCVNDISKNISTLIISCQDTGRGIKAENIQKLYTKFERLDIEKNTTAEGTGLGLAITKSLVEMMDGKINVNSQFGKGSIFMIQLPQKIAKLKSDNTAINNCSLLSNFTSAINKKEQTGIQEGTNDTKKLVDYNGKRVLIVDDNNLNIKVAKKAIADFNFIIDEARDGLQCLEKIKVGNEYDLILMDIMMPKMSGESALKKLKENKNFNIPVIALTADAVAGAKERYVDEGFFDYLSKPFKKEQIKELLDKIFFNGSNKNNVTTMNSEDILKY